MHATFTAAGLDAQLDRETLAYFAQPENFRIDAANRPVWLGEILDFCPEDFVPRQAASIIEYANRCAPEQALPSFRVRFTPYDWAVANSQQPSAAASRPVEFYALKRNH